MMFLREFNLKQKSKIFNLGAILFQRELDLETKLPAGVSVIMVVSFLLDILYWEWRDIGLLNLRILVTSISVWYVYKLCRARILCSLNNGFVCSFT